MIFIETDTRIDPRFPLSSTELRLLVEAALSVAGMKDASLTLRLVDDAEIARLNEVFMGCTGPTNVLSFPFAQSDEDAGSELGQIALSVDTLAREARLYGQAPRTHTARLVAHAVLHLAGLDHGAEMEALTEAAVQAATGAGR